jgi:mannose-6-phosphate isomerase-like protein (cupin superfamily)
MDGHGSGADRTGGSPSASVRPVSLETAFAAISEHWSPRVAAEANAQHLKIAKVQGEFLWHHHADEDELFLVWKGALRLEFRPGGPGAPERLPEGFPSHVTLGPGELFVVPRGVDHRPVAEEEVELVMFEPAGTLNTGNVRNERTVEDLETLS